MRHICKPSVLALLTCITSNVTFAGSADLTTCPLVGNIKTSHLELTLPYGYNIHTNTMDTLVVANYPAHANQTFNFLIRPVHVKTNENLIDNVNLIISQLQPVSNTPLTIHLNDEDGDLSVCPYHIPGDESVTAFLIADDDDNTNDSYTYDAPNASTQDFSHIETHRAHARQLLSMKLL
jgi:hypothetical protein